VRSFKYMWWIVNMDYTVFSNIVLAYLILNTNYVELHTVEIG
jgi:hypothetical protein